MTIKVLKKSRIKLRHNVNPTEFDLMEDLRHDGWLVVIKCLPVEINWIIEGSRSEYDNPCPDRPIGKGKWVCEAKWIRQEDYHPSEFSFGDTPMQAITKVWFQIKGLK